MSKSCAKKSQGKKSTRKNKQKKSVPQKNTREYIYETHFQTKQCPTTGPPQIFLSKIPHQKINKKHIPKSWSLLTDQNALLVAYKRPKIEQQVQKKSPQKVPRINTAKRTHL